MATIIEAGIQTPVQEEIVAPEPKDEAVAVSKSSKKK
jgi:hypothetical protein